MQHIAATVARKSRYCRRWRSVNGAGCRTNGLNVGGGLKMRSKRRDIISMWRLVWDGSRVTKRREAAEESLQCSRDCQSTRRGGWCAPQTFAQPAELNKTKFVLMSIHIRVCFLMSGYFPPTHCLSLRIDGTHLKAKQKKSNLKCNYKPTLQASILIMSSARTFPDVPHGPRFTLRAPLCMRPCLNKPVDPPH